MEFTAYIGMAIVFGFLGGLSAMALLVWHTVSKEMSRVPVRGNNVRDLYPPKGDNQ